MNNSNFSLAFTSMDDTRTYFFFPERKDRGDILFFRQTNTLAYRYFFLFEVFHNDNTYIIGISYFVILLIPAEGDQLNRMNQIGKQMKKIMAHSNNTIS